MKKEITIGQKTPKKDSMLTVTKQVNDKSWLCTCECGGTTMVELHDMDRRVTCGCKRVRSKPKSKELDASFSTNYLKTLKLVN